MRSITRLVIHCSSTPNDVWVAPEQIDAWHRARGFHRAPAFSRKFRPKLSSIAFHRVIQADGGVTFCRDIDEEASDNPGTVAICMIGTNAFFLAQWIGLREAVLALAQHLAERAGCPSRVPYGSHAEAAITILRSLEVAIVGHRDLPPSQGCAEMGGSSEWLHVCPGFDVRTWLDNGMEPEPVHVLDDHPAIAQSDPLMRAMSSMRYGGL